jgi:hypothetical protein
LTGKEGSGRKEGRKWKEGSGRKLKEMEGRKEVDGRKERTKLKEGRKEMEAGRSHAYDEANIVGQRQLKIVV